MGGCILKIVTAKGGGGVQFLYVIIWEGTVLIHHTFLKTPAAPWDVINVWSLNPLEGDFLLMQIDISKS